MVTGIHAIFYTKHSKEMYEFLKDILELHYVDAGNGRLFFAAPPTELAVHEHETDDSEHELWLICDNIAATVQQLEKKGIKSTPVADRGWGLVTQLRLPGGDVISLYEPNHPSPLA